MTKRIFIMFLLLITTVGLYAMHAKTKSHKMPTATNTPSQTATNTLETCEIKTGIDGGTVNLRKCEGTSCEVEGVLTEGERLTILKVGAWLNVTTQNGMTGYINSKYCKGK